jgi:hypothetical protein
VFDAETRSRIAALIGSPAWLSLLTTVDDPARRTLAAFAEGVRAGELDRPELLQARIAQQPGGTAAVAAILPLLEGRLEDLGAGLSAFDMHPPPLAAIVAALGEHLADLPPAHADAVAPALRTLSGMDLSGVMGALSEMPALIAAVRDATSSGVAVDDATLARIGRALGAVEAEADQLQSLGEQLGRDHARLSSALRTLDDAYEELARESGLAGDDAELRAAWVAFERAVARGPSTLAISLGDTLVARAAASERFLLAGLAAERLAGVLERAGEQDRATAALLDAAASNAAAERPNAALALLDRAERRAPGPELQARALLLRGRLGELTDDTDAASAAYRALVKLALTLEAGASYAARGAHGLARLAYGADRTTWLARAVSFAEAAADADMFADFAIELATHLDSGGERIQALTVLVQCRSDLQGSPDIQARVQAAGEALAERWGQRTFREVLRQVAGLNEAGGG